MSLFDWFPSIQFFCLFFFPFLFFFFLLSELVTLSICMISFGQMDRRGCALLQKCLGPFTAEENPSSANLIY